ncbi:hypothetical protein [Legionella waltersii]|uniref:Uncharacterized protein n=1 Tax=Legionella waltersii TaxID=66969 RepID=A0A0W0ZZX3_9GAMM|nr:hypothetical protein [Legionella waltersii]KTD74635.1 hypothetical protein Lwal_2676 [Legionella waltersii]SNV08926.1 Uncharacterised protein [Legionella waltersii]
MISLTTYWQQFKDCIDCIRVENASEHFLNQLRTANDLITAGMTIETLGITAIKGVGSQLAEIAKNFNHEVSIPAPPDVYRFYLPKIIETNGLILAITYYQHLSNYQHVQYQGSITFFRGTVEKGVEEKKIKTKFQASAMLNEIRDYCKKNSINLNESELLRKQEESAKEYMTRIIKTYSPPPETKIENKSPPKVVQKSELQKLGECLEILKSKEMELQSKIDSLAKKLIEYRQSSHQYLELNKEWNDKSFVTKFFVWLMSWFKKDTFIHQLAEAQKKHDTATLDLNNEFMPYSSPENYQTVLKIQIRALHSEYEDTKKHMEQISLEQFKNDLKQQLPPKAPDSQAIPLTHQQLTTTVCPVRKDSSYRESNSYSLFNEYAPSKETMLSVGVAIAAVAYESLRSTC